MSQSNGTCGDSGEVARATRTKRGLCAAGGGGKIDDDNVLNYGLVIGEDAFVCIRGDPDLCDDANNDANDAMKNAEKDVKIKPSIWGSVMGKVTGLFSNTPVNKPNANDFSTAPPVVESQFAKAIACGAYSVVNKTARKVRAFTHLWRLFEITRTTSKKVNALLDRMNVMLVNAVEDLNEYAKDIDEIGVYAKYVSNDKLKQLVDFRIAMETKHNDITKNVDKYNTSYHNVGNMIDDKIFALTQVNAAKAAADQAAADQAAAKRAAAEQAAAKQAAAEQAAADQAAAKQAAAKQAAAKIANVRHTSTI